MTSIGQATETGIANRLLPSGVPDQPSYTTAVLLDAPVAYYRLEETSGTLMADSSSYGRNGSYVGSPTLGVAGRMSNPSGTAMQVTAAGYGDVPFAAWQNVMASLTVEAWVKTTAGGVVVGRNDDGGRPWFFSMDTANGLYFQWRIGAGTDWYIRTSDPVVIDGNWHHVLVTYATGVGGKLYVDGVQQTINGTGTTTTAAINLGFNVGVRIGRRGNGNPVPITGGRIDEVALYDKVLSQGRITAHYQAGVYAAPASIPVGQAEETSAAQPIAVLAGTLSILLGQAIDAPAAQPVTVQHGVLYVPVGGAVEADEALGPVGSFTGGLPVLISPVSTTETAQPVAYLPAPLFISLTGTSETDAPGALTVLLGVLAVPIGQAQSLDEAEPVEVELGLSPGARGLYASVVTRSHAAAHLGIAGVEQGPTDTSNLAGSRTRLGSAEDATTYPARPLPDHLRTGARRIAAQRLPAPTLVNGRPT